MPLGLSRGPPTMAVLPLADSATEAPCSAFPTAPVPTSFGPCCENCACAGCDEKSSVAKTRTDAADNPGVLACAVGQTPGVIEASYRGRFPPNTCRPREQRLKMQR